MLLSLGLVQYIKQPTRVTIKTRSLIDVIYICSGKDLYPFVRPTSISNHYLVGIVRNLNYVSPKKIEVNGRTYRNYNRELAKDYYARVNMDLIYSMHDVDLIWETLYRIITNCANVLYPIRTLKTRPNRLPWLTAEVTEIINDRDDLFLEDYANADQDLLCEAKSLKTKASKAIRNARATYVQEQLGRNQSDPKKFWKELNLLVKNQSIQPKISLNDDDGLPVPYDSTANFIKRIFCDYRA